MTNIQTLLVNRDEESRDLESLLTEILSGRSATAVIDGPVGIGKTALLDTVERAARSRGLVVLKARCSTIERDFPFGVVRQLLGPVLSTPGHSGRAAAVEARTVLAELPYRAADARPAAVAFDQLEALCAPVLQLAADRAVVIAVDDVQWADEYSAQWLAFLARRLAEIPVLVAVTSRSSTPSACADLADELMLHPACRVLRPGPLTVDGAARVLGQALGACPEEPFSLACHAMSGGNPAVLAALVRDLARADVPPIAAGSAQLAAVAARVLPVAVRSALRRESPEVLGVASLLGVLGAGTEPAVLQSVTGLEPLLVNHAVTVLEGSGLLLPGPPRRFSHQLVKEALAGAMAATDRATAHADAARALFTARASAERISAHIIAGAGTGEPWRVEVLRRAARCASDRGAVEVAVRCLRHALTETSSVEVRRRLLVELGCAEAYTDVAACARHLGEAEELIHDPAERAGFLPLLAQALAQSGQPRRAVELLDRAAAQLPDTDRRLLRILGRRAVIADGGRPDTWDSLADRGPCREVAGRTPEERGLLAALAMRSSMRLEGADRAAALAERALRGFDHTEDQVLTAVLATGALLHADRVESARRWSEEFGAGDAGGPPALRAVLAAVRGKVLHRTGELSRARQEAECALDLTDEPHPYLPYAAAVALQVLLDSGDTGTAELISHSLTEAPEPENWPWPYFLEARARLLAVQGQPRAALRDIEACGRLQEAQWGDNPGRIAWRSRAALLEHRLKRPEAAREYAAQELHQARAWASPVALARALRVSAVVGTRRTAQAELEESVALLADTSDPLELARSLLALGGLFCDTGRTEAGREQLRRALGLAQAASATGLAGQAHRALLASGARPRRLPQVGPGSLTSSQLRIAMLATEGLSNDDIAAQLYITRRTVEFHLTNAYRKLGIDGRVGLREALLGAGHAPQTGSAALAKAG